MLRISLRDGERIIVNGAVLRAVGRMTLCVENDSMILRGRSVMTPEDADTPARRLYFACMLAYIEPDRVEDHRSTIATLGGELYVALADAQARQDCLEIMRHGAEGDFYRACTACWPLIRYEAAAMGRAPVLAA